MVLIGIAFVCVRGIQSCGRPLLGVVFDDCDSIELGDCNAENDCFDLLFDDTTG